MNERNTFTFSPGPSQFPREVLIEAQKEFLDYKGLGISILEMSHRSKDFENIINDLTKNVRTFMQVPDNYRILYMQGGSTLQFSAVCLNLLGNKNSANYLVTGHWSEKAAEEAKKYCNVHYVVDLKEAQNKKFSTVSEKMTFDKNAAYTYYCDNETIAGLEFAFTPTSPDHYLVCDMSSNFASKSIDWPKYGCVFACGQKNFGPTGITIVIVREDLIGKYENPLCPLIMSYKVTDSSNSLYNTGPTFQIYMANIYFKYMISKGNINWWDNFSKQKANSLYKFFENSNGYYISPVDPKYRSRMNIPFLIKGNKENEFCKEAKAEGLLQLEGHRSVGGCRASIYNGMGMEAIEKLLNFMTRFMQKYP